jgi:fatty-acyl-CoA synthase
MSWVDGLTIGQVLDRTAAEFADRDAAVFVSADVRFTWRQLQARVDEAARGLLALGIERGQHVALWATNVPEWVVLQLATARIGAVLATVNPAYRAFELRYVLRQSDAVALFLVDHYKTSDYYSMLAEVCPELAEAEPGRLSAAEYPNLRWVVSLKSPPPAGAISWQEMLRRGREIRADRPAECQAALSATDAINIQYTSGTTGFPKAATLTHRGLLLNGYHVGQCQHFTHEDRVCVPVPFYHCFGCVLGTLGTLTHGAAMIVPGEWFHPTTTLEAIERERATALYGVPTMFIAELQDESFARRDLSSLRTGIMSGSPCPIEVMKQVVEQMGVREITIAYGQTEASPVITQTRAEDPLVLRVETVGRPLPGVEVKLVEPGTGRVVGDNEQGELCCRGHLVMLGYYQHPEATALAIDAEGWLHTGDLALRQPNGYYRITGRIKDLVIRGGENIYPREVEEFLFTHPAVAQAAVFGVPDPKFVEELCAWVKLKPGAAISGEELRQYCRGQLAHFKVPRYVRLVEEFPQTVSGKIQKYKMREVMVAELGLAEQKTA